MDKEKIVLDFAIFVLMEVEELCDYILCFFNQKDDDPFSSKKLLEYEEFIRKGIETSEIIINLNYNDNLKSISNLLESEEIFNLLNYLNENFTEGYPDGDGFGAPTNLEFKTADLHRLFNEYLILRNYNKNVFVTYYIQLLLEIEHKSRKFIEIEKQKIINIENTKDLLNFDLSKEYIENKKAEYKIKLFKSVENNNFQFKGFSDVNGLYFDYDKSLTSYLEFLNKDDCTKIEYTVNYKEFEHALDYLLYQFLEDKLFNTNNINSKNTNQFDKDLLNDLNQLKLEHKNLVNFLSDKNFSENEIDNIFNVLTKNEYGSLNKRYIGINQVEFYNFCNLFYILDYFKEIEQIDFNKINSFDKILMFNKGKKLNYSKTDYQKYFKGIDSSIKNIDKLYKKIDDSLKINKEKLKEIK